MLVPSPVTTTVAPVPAPVVAKAAVVPELSAVTKPPGSVSVAVGKKVSNVATV